MKKEISWILLFITALKIGGFLAILSVEREIVRSGMKEKIAKSIDINSLTNELNSTENTQSINPELKSTEDTEFNITESIDKLDDYIS